MPPSAPQPSAPRARPPQLQPPARARPSPANAAPKARRHSLQFSFPPLFQSNTSSASLVPSTAEGKPIPVDDSTAEHRTTALRELNNNFPSRHRYAKSTGAQSSTYSQPVIVHSYYSPSPQAHGGIVVVNRRGPASATGGPAAVVRRLLPTGGAVLSNMPRPRAKKQAPDTDDAKLPPIEAFSFKSIMANMDEQAGGSDINADLDRIAEICAKSRYSLSNQYEVHYAPHGSGSSFLHQAAQNHESQGPTLQAISSDDEHLMKRHRKRRSGMRRDSRAMGTLETIMSSSRSSEEDKSKKMSAAEIADGVRGRAARKEPGIGSPASSRSLSDSHSAHEEAQPTTKNVRARRSGSLALIDGPRQSVNSVHAATPRTSATGLAGEPALPLTSRSQLELRTAPEPPVQATQPRRMEIKTAPQEDLAKPVARGAISSAGEPGARSSIVSALTGWLPWKAPDALRKPHGRAEGSLRELLRGKDIKGKAVERIT